MPEKPAYDPDHDWDLSVPDFSMLEYADVFWEGPRGTAIRAVAILEADLDELLEAKIPKTSLPDLTGNNNKLHKKLTLAREHSLIDKDSWHDFRRIADIRNRFAHDKERSWDDAVIHDLLRDISHIKGLFPAEELQDLSRTDMVMGIGCFDSDIMPTTNKGDPFARGLFIGVFHHIREVIIYQLRDRG